MMRIAVATWSSRRVGGVEDYLNLVLPALHHSGAQLALWHETAEPSGRSPIELPPGGTDICCAVDGRQLSLQRLRDWKPDVIYVHGLADTSLEASMLTIAPAVFFLHTYSGTCISGRKTFGRPALSPCNRTFGSGCLGQYFPKRCGGRSPVTMWKLFAVQSERLRLFGLYRAILTHTEHMRGEMEKHGIRARVVPYPVPPQIHRSTPAPRQPRSWHLLFAGRMEDLKGGDVFVDALGIVARAAGDRLVRATFAGDGTERRAWEARAHDLAGRHGNLRIDFTGWRSQAEVSGLMAAADLLVVPSLWPEPFGSVGPAAGQHGVPAAAFASGGITQWLENGVTGHLAPADPPGATGLAHAIVQCLEDPAHHAALCEGARKMSERFTVERHLPALLEVLAAAAGQPHVRAAS